MTSDLDIYRSATVNIFDGIHRKNYFVRFLTNVNKCKAREIIYYSITDVI